MEGRKKSKKKVIIIVVVAVAVFLILVISAVSRMAKGMQDAMEAMAGADDSIFKVEKQDVEQEITTSGMVVGLERDAYVSPVTAKVNDVRVEVGQTVKKGDILLTYDDSELGDNLERVRIQAQTERAAGNESYEVVNEAASKTSAAKKKVKDLEDDIKKLKKEISELTEEVEEYEEQIQAAAAAKQAKTTEQAFKVTDATEESGQTESSTEAYVAPEEENEDSEVDQKAYKKAVSNLQKKQESLAGKQSELAEQQAIITANQDAKVSESTKAQISATNQLSDMNINAAQESLDAAKAGLTAEHDGVVESVDIIKGAYANETMTLMTIIHSDKVGVECSISKDDLGSISPGQKARVVISGNEYEGTVDFVSRVAKSDSPYTSTTSTGGTIKGRITIDDPDDKIYIGVSAKVYIFVGESKQTLVVPYEALNTDINGDFVYIVNGENLIERRDVTIGIYSDAYYEILDGLSEGDSVITQVTPDMKPGDSYVGPDMMGAAAAE